MTKKTKKYYFLLYRETDFDLNEVLFFLSYYSIKDLENIFFNKKKTIKYLKKYYKKDKSLIEFISSVSMIEV